jgi:hypothetical protein
VHVAARLAGGVLRRSARAGHRWWPGLGRLFDDNRLPGACCRSSTSKPRAGATSSTRHGGERALLRPRAVRSPALRALMAGYSRPPAVPGRWDAFPNELRLGLRLRSPVCTTSSCPVEEAPGGQVSGVHERLRILRGAREAWMASSWPWPPATTTASTSA